MLFSIGTSPKALWSQKGRQPEFMLVKEDIERSGPRKLHVRLNKPDFNLTNADIAGSKTQANKFTTKREPSNPLEPVYKLASYTYLPPETPKFLRDSMKVDDIEGT